MKRLTILLTLLLVAACATDPTGLRRAPAVANDTCDPTAFICGGSNGQNNPPTTMDTLSLTSACKSIFLVSVADSLYGIYAMFGGDTLRVPVAPGTQQFYALNVNTSPELFLGGTITPPITLALPCPAASTALR